MALTLEETDSPDWFVNAAFELKNVKPRWCRAPVPIELHDGSEIATSAVGWIVAALRDTEAEAANHDLVDYLKRYATPNSLDTWTSTMLEQWANGKCPKIDLWVLTACGLFGKAETARLLRERIRSWSAAKDRALAVRGVDVLSRIDDEKAIEQIQMITSGVRDRAVMDEADQAISRKAKKRGIDRQELDDHTMADAGFDAKGTRWLDFGPRKFQVILRPDLSLVIENEQGNRLKNMPRIAKSDDPELAKQAKEDWSEIRLVVRRVIKSQVSRFENAMLSGQRWTVGSFRKNLLAHPIVSKFLQTLVFRRHGGQREALRLAEDFTFANYKDETIELRDRNQISIVHPLNLTLEEREGFTEILFDYQIVQPFSQLDRDVYHCLKPAADSTAIKAPKNHQPIKSGVLYGILDNDGWRLGYPSEHAFFYSWKYFPAEGVSAMIFYSGLYVGEIGKSPDQQIEKVEFRNGEDKGNQLDSIPLGKVPPIAYSEAMRRLHRLTASASS